MDFLTDSADAVPCFPCLLASRELVQCILTVIRFDEVNDCCLTDGADVLYNKFNVDSSSPPDNPPEHPNSDYNCVVATTGQWRVSRCNRQHRVVCQSIILPGSLL